MKSKTKNLFWLGTLLIIIQILPMSCDKENLLKDEWFEYCDDDLNELDSENSYLTIMKGDSPEQCYQKIQDLYTSDQIILMNVLHEGFPSIDNFNNIMELFSDFQITTTNFHDINFYFENDTLVKITNFSMKEPLTSTFLSLNEWPSVLSEDKRIFISETKHEVYVKLNKMKEDGELENQVAKIFYSRKDLNEGYTEYMSNATYWTILESESFYYNITFNDDGVCCINKKEVIVVGAN